MIDQNITHELLNAKVNLGKLNAYTVATSFGTGRDYCCYVSSHLNTVIQEVCSACNRGSTQLHLWQ